MKWTRVQKVECQWNRTYILEIKSVSLKRRRISKNELQQNLRPSAIGLPCVRSESEIATRSPIVVVWVENLLEHLCPDFSKPHRLVLRFVLMSDVSHEPREKAMQQERTLCVRLASTDALAYLAIFSYARKALVVHVDACLRMEKDHMSVWPYALMRTNLGHSLQRISFATVDLLVSLLRLSTHSKPRPHVLMIEQWKL